MHFPFCINARHTPQPLHPIITSHASPLRFSLCANQIAESKQRKIFSQQSYVTLHPTPPARIQSPHSHLSPLPSRLSPLRQAKFPSTPLTPSKNNN